MGPPQIGFHTARNQVKTKKPGKIESFRGTRCSFIRRAAFWKGIVLLRGAFEMTTKTLISFYLVNLIDFFPSFFVSIPYSHLIFGNYFSNSWKRRQQKSALSKTHFSQKPEEGFGAPPESSAPRLTWLFKVLHLLFCLFAFSLLSRQRSASADASQKQPGHWGELRAPAVKEQLQPY